MPQPASGNFIPHFMETEVEKERIGLTLWDSEGLEKNLVDLQLRELSAFIESKFEETFTEEMRVIRSPGVQDTHIHAVFLVLDPSRLDRNIEVAHKNAKANGYTYDKHTSTAGALDDEIDLSILRALHHKTTVIPVIAKADTITTKHMSILKKSVWECIKNAGLDPIEALGLEDDDAATDRIDEEAEEEAEIEAEEATEQEPDVAPTDPSALQASKRLSSQSIRRHKAQEESKEDDVPFLPLSIISPDQYEPSVVGRQFPWGFADPYNDQHCDFQRLKEAVFSEWRSDLRESSRDRWYEGWRTNRLKVRSMPYRRI